MKIKDFLFKKSNLGSYIMMGGTGLFYSGGNCKTITKEEYNYLSDIKNKEHLEKVQKDEEQKELEEKQSEIYKNSKPYKINNFYSIKMREDLKYNFINKKGEIKLDKIVFSTYIITDNSIKIKDVNILAKHPYKNRNNWQKCDEIEINKKGLKIINKTENYF